MRASLGACAVAPTAVIKPSRMTMVPFSIAGPDTGTIRAFVIAYTVGTFRVRWTPICALSSGGARPSAEEKNIATIIARGRRVFIADTLLVRCSSGGNWLDGRTRALDV